MRKAQIEKAYESGLLDKEKHQRLTMDLERIAKAAGIPPQAVLQPMEASCPTEVIEWVKKLRQKEAGFVYVGGKNIERMFFGIAGACIRNFIDAKCMTLQEALGRVKDHSMPESSVLLIPNFFIKKDDGGSIPKWQIAQLSDMLLSRLSSMKLTILWVQDMKSLEAEYGTAIKEHVENYYEVIYG